MGGTSVSWFEIPADNPKKLVDFYKKTFGWTAEQYPGMEYFLLDTHANDSGISGAITKRRQLKTPANTLYVKSLDEAIAGVKVNGGRMVSEKISIPDVGTYAYCTDPEGNVFGMLQQASPS